MAQVLTRLKLRRAQLPYIVDQTWQVINLNQVPHVLDVMNLHTINQSVQLVILFVILVERKVTGKELAEVPKKVNEISSVLTAGTFLGKVTDTVHFSQQPWQSNFTLIAGQMYLLFLQTCFQN